MRVVYVPRSIEIKPLFSDLRSNAVVRKTGILMFLVYVQGSLM